MARWTATPATPPVAIMERRYGATTMTAIAETAGVSLRNPLFVGAPEGRHRPAPGRAGAFRD